MKIKKANGCRVHPLHEDDILYIPLHEKKVTSYPRGLNYLLIMFN